MFLNLQVHWTLTQSCSWETAFKGH